jgi:HemY protein
MKRLILPAVLLVALGLLGWAMASNPGQASADWLGWRIDTSAALAVVLLVLAVLAACALWTAVLWLAGMPRRGARKKTEAQRSQAGDVLARGWLALAAGDAAEARRLAAQARSLDEGVLPRLLAAQGAEAAGDDGAAQTLYAALLEIPEARLAARAGLSRLDARRASPPSPAEPDLAPPVAEAPLSLGA